MRTTRYCPTLHAEKLHDPEVWHQVTRTLDKSGMPWTVFVEPLDARVRNIDLRPHLDWFAERGHEIALHVHHRPLHGPPGHTSGYDKKRSADPDFVRRCMDEAFDYLNDAGHRPVGFVAGTWLLLESAFEWLADHAFVYDCSIRTYQGADDDATVANREPLGSVTELGGVLEVPTTASLRRQAWAELTGRDIAGDAGPMAYHLFYLHDYDLVDVRKRLVLRAISARRRTVGTTVRALISTAAGSENN